MRNFIQKSINSQKVFYRYIRRKGWKRFLKENILESEGSNATKAKSIALGIFIGFSPFWGFHTVLALSLPIYFRLNKMLTFLFAQITIAPLIPFFVYISLIIGAPFVNGRTDFGNQEFNLKMAKNNLIQYVVGSLVLASITAIVLGTTSYLLMNRLSNKNKT